MDEVRTEYIYALSRKKIAVLSLAAEQVACEESEAMLLEAFSAEGLERLHDVHYVTDEPKSATGRYFDAVSSIRFDLLEV